MIGVIQEQHAERCRLYAQWKNFKFPIVQDSMTQLDLAVVPVPILIDEHGIVRYSRRVRPQQLENFVKEEFDAPKNEVAKTDLNEVTIETAKRRVQSDPTAANWVSLGDANLNWGEADQIDDAIEAYQKALQLSPNDSKSLFRLGVAFRRRFDSKNVQSGDFTRAVSYWTDAVTANPNQYIWRRRIQQYGPRLDKPYPFYDWVPTAISEITKRGEKPVELKVALAGAEIAKPQRTFAAATEATNPDPNGSIQSDDQILIAVRSTMVPAKIRAGQSARVHLEMEPKNGKWNNESDPVAIWIEDGDSIQVTRRLITLKNPEAAESTERRVAEFEIKTDKSADPTKLNGFALYYACDNDTGQCLYLRQEFSIDIEIR